MSTADAVERSASRSTSRSLIARLHADDPAAWDRIVALYAPYVHYYCRRTGLPAHDAGDVFQEVFQAAYSKIASFEKRKPGDTFRGWLRMITLNKVRDHFRRQERQPRAVGGSAIQLRLQELEQATVESAASSAPADSPERALFRAALASVQPRVQATTWAAFEQTVLHGRAAPDVAADLGLSPGAVRVAKSRVLQRLRVALGDGPAATPASSAR